MASADASLLAFHFVIVDTAALNKLAVTKAFLLEGPFGEPTEHWPAIIDTHVIVL